MKTLLRNGNVNFLELGRFNELEDSYFAELFAIKSSTGRFCFQNIETLNLFQMENITSRLISWYFFHRIPNSLTYLDLYDCKKISKKDFIYLQKLTSSKGYECEINWR